MIALLMVMGLFVACAKPKPVADAPADEVEGNILHPVVESGINEAILDARDASIYVITYFIDASETEVPFVKVDESDPAAMMGENMAKQ